MSRHSDQPAGRPRRRNKSRPGKPGRGYLILGLAAGAVALLAVVIIGGVVLWSRATPAKMTAPERYAPYNSPEDVFHVSLPRGWKIQSGGRKGMLWVSAEKGSASIKI